MAKSQMKDARIQKELNEFVMDGNYEELFQEMGMNCVEFRSFMEWIFNKNLEMEVQKQKKINELENAFLL